MNPKQITYWKPADEILDSGYGHIRYDKWCKLEIENIRKPREVLEVRESLKGFIAIFKVK
jgi:hypothetical protein